ncbi:ATP-binding protein [Bathymodiolus septemdierum thioautotrophic gill symbiont]|uniref:AAA+ ATPase domain-containing protein n=1 Tax=endosymbiont of Bathymodiolus septemdierum str. Myojin knoll TaxID=1303921 RepID=A0A0P0URB2_9GAMM|nr:ATP-binding protein [Bathymodiolus septemdierum thioautotrophic gill symbiont]BAS67409.1 conserved hypothetical protein [endosymbiont of Bathymodiolus septemdierum str. Myojin knoll]
MNRVQLQKITQDLTKKMVFLTGPRQVGKTSLSLSLIGDTQSNLYLNYDNFEHRAQIEQMNWLPSVTLLVLDELHKMPNWKNYLKGLYDTKSDGLQILVTGSARLETFRQTGDSLAGRFFSHRLNPFSLSELLQVGDIDNNTIDRLIERGGFPEPFLAESTEDANRWRLQYIDGLIRTDILDFEKIHDFKAIQLLLELLRTRVGSPISYSSLARDLACSANTVKRYIEIFEALMIIFKVTPYHKNIERSLLKESKVYFFDNGMVKDDDGIKFENFVAISLLKHQQAIEDYQGVRTKLSYIRTKDKKEIDFALVVDNEIDVVIEVKLSDIKLSSSLLYFQKKYQFPKAIQLVKNLKNERIESLIEVRNAQSYLTTLYM